MSTTKPGENVIYEISEVFPGSKEKIGCDWQRVVRNLIYYQVISEKDAGKISNSAKVEHPWKIIVYIKTGKKSLAEKILANLEKQVNLSYRDTVDTLPATNIVVLERVEYLVYPDFDWFNSCGRNPPTLKWVAKVVTDEVGARKISLLSGPEVIGSNSVRIGVQLADKERFGGLVKRLESRYHLKCVD